jgi:hypothetical protein
MADGGRLMADPRCATGHAHYARKQREMAYEPTWKGGR